jgi:aspartate aminotransferase
MAPAASPARASAPATGMAGSAILKVVADVAAKKAAGRPICDLTMGDFDPRQFPIPTMLRDGIEAALRDGQTSYPPGAGMPALRESIRAFSRQRMGLDYSAESVLVTSGARPGIYAAYRTLVDPGDRVVYAVPSWQNSYYCQLVGATPVVVSCDASTGFLPTRAALEPAVRGARLLALNSPLNPTGTMFDAAGLGDICDLVLEENARRAGRDRPLYLLYDQVYWMLTLGDAPHVTPVALRPAIAPYTVSVDAISKSFAATGLRVGWVLGPTDIVRLMSDFLSHVGTWAPRPEQVAAAAFLASPEAVDEYHRGLRRGLRARLDALYQGIMRMRATGLPVDATPPAGAIYLSAQFALPLGDNEAIRAYLLDEADFAAIPFQGFGVTEDSGWFRLSAGAVSVADIEAVLPKVAAAAMASSTSALSAAKR